MNAPDPAAPTVPPDGPECFLEQVARTLNEDDSLRAVKLDGRKGHLAFAVPKTSDGTSARQRLESLAAGYAGVPECLSPDSGKSCEECLRRSQRSLPQGIRLRELDGRRLLLEKAGEPERLRWLHFEWLHLPHGKEAQAPGTSAFNPQIALAAACGVLTVAGFVAEKVDATPAWSLAPYLGAYLAGGWFAVQEVAELLRKRILDIHFLMIAVAVGAAIIGHWWEGAMLLFLFSTSDALEDMAMARTEREIESLFHDAPKVATVLDEAGAERAVPVDDLRAGMRLRVLPDEQFAVDAEVLRGNSAANESSLTGEAVPVDKNPGDTVFSGTINLWGPLECRVLKPASESAQARIIRLIRDAQESKAPSQRFTDRFGSKYTFGLLGTCIVMFLVWWLGMGVPAFTDTPGQTSAFYRAMTLLVVASPCALVISIPSAILAGIAAGARRGVLFRGGFAIEKLTEVRRVAMDKTGTLTTGVLELDRVESFPPGREDEILAAAAALARHSGHPISRAITREGRTRAGVETEVTDYHSIPGMGVRGQLSHPGQGGAIEARMGRRSFFQGAEWVANLPREGETIVETLIEVGDLRGRVLLRDEIRQESAGLIAEMRAAGLKPTMLTGDRENSARAVAAALHLDDVRFELTPADKVRLVQGWVDAGENPAMIGDGVNDAPSLTAAHVGVAMGVRGSDAALEQADVVLMQDRLENFLYAYRLSARARGIIRQNLAISLGVIVVLVLGALGAAIPLTLGVVGHEGSTVIVVFNSLRLLWHK